MALKPADQKVIDTFTDGVLDIPEGPKSAFYARGGTLYGPANSKLARLKYNWVIWIGVGGTKYQDDTYRYLKKTVPAKRFKGHGSTEVEPNGARISDKQRAMLAIMHEAWKDGGRAASFIVADQRKSVAGLIQAGLAEETSRGKYAGQTEVFARLTPAGLEQVKTRIPNSKSSMGFVVDAKTQDFLRPANRADMLKSLQSPTGEFSEGGRRVLVRNGSVVPDNYAEAKKVGDRLEEKSEVTSKRLKALSGGGSMGLTPDYVKDTPEWKKASKDFKIAFAELRTFNGEFVKKFKKEIQQERRTRNGTKPHPRPPRPRQAPILIPERVRHGSGKTFPSLQSFVQSSVKSQTGAGDLRRMQAEYEEERYPWRSDLRPNSSTSEEDWGSEEILRGMVLGFWLQGWASAMEEAGLPTPRSINENTAPEPPEELTDFAMAFANRLLDLNGGMDLFQLSKRVGVKPSDWEEFGYYLAMESLGHGVAWSDDHEDHGLKIPDTEVGFSLEDPDDEDSAQLDYAAVASR